MEKRLFFIVFVLPIFIITCSTTKELTLEESFLLKKDNFLENFNSFKINNNLPRNTKVESINVDYTAKVININFNRDFSFIALRDDNVSRIYLECKQIFGERFTDFHFNLSSMNYPIEQLIPNYFRRDADQVDNNRISSQKPYDRIPVVKNLDKKYSATNGLDKTNILLWHSHGWYYNNAEKTWMWQRPRLFQIIEDLLPASFTIPYLIPMLENAGANVFVPRERDVQVNEVIVDNDTDNSTSYIEHSTGDYNWKSDVEPGFGMKSRVLSGSENPFKMGTSRFTNSSVNETATVHWLPDIPETGEYAVYISYKSSDNNVSDALYEVYHSGGITKFNVNQQIGGNTWIYLGKFKFLKGRFDEQGVLLSNRSSENDKIVSADAVRFGGGMGIVERNGQTSGRAKFMEGARYWLQYAGMPDTLVYNLNDDSDDYKDDYQSRAEYGNYLYGNPFGPNNKKDERGLGIPIDASLAWHTDAGITRSDTVIGTLMIYSIPGLDSLHIFPDSVSRLANRDLSDIVQTQIVDDLRFKYDSVWTRRQLMNSMYSEAARPNFPSMLLELLSHQNFFDMKFALDPSFRFDASRAIYKGILKFLSYQFDYEFVVQPLPVSDFSAVLQSDGKIYLSWKLANDELEPTAVPDKYIVYTRIDDGGFDNGIDVNSQELLIENIEAGRIYSFKVTAVNKGGESFPSEILSVGWIGENSETALIVNGFNRVAPAASLESKDFSGFMDFVDEGVPYIYDIGYTGSQYNFNPESEWETDDKPGHGASSSNYETEIIAGNTFDFSYVHGKSIFINGMSFCSASMASVLSGKTNLNNYRFVDIIFGEQKKTPMPKYRNHKKFEVFSDGIQSKIKEYLNSGGKIFLSGAYIASDPYDADDDSSSIKFVNDVLKYKLRTGHAAKTGTLYPIKDNFISDETFIQFNTAFNDSIYKVEAPDAIAGINGGEILLGYSENNFSAGVGYKGNYAVVAFGFPFETVLYEEQRNLLMNSVIKYLGLK
ncbi:MAG: fibronectin type III domain-containing protein [Ignavibacteriaceae bacterium]